MSSVFGSRLARQGGQANDVRHPGTNNASQSCCLLLAASPSRPRRHHECSEPWRRPPSICFIRLTAHSTLLPTLCLSAVLCIQSSTTGLRHMSEYTGPWPGPNPLKDIFYGLSLGLVFAIVFKSWQIKDKADRVHFYQEYERAVRVEEARKEKDRQERAARGETEDEDSEEESADEE